MKALIFANGELNPPPTGLLQIQDRDTIIAADGGLHNCRLLGLQPDVVIGDFDSLTPEEVIELESQDVTVIRHPARKDYTDLELALQYAAEAGSHDILVLGALGNRWDQTIANLLVAASKSFSRVKIRLIDGQQEIRLLNGGETLELQGTPGDTVSLIPLCGDAAGITTQGLEYPLNSETLFFGATRGVSNVLLETEASINLGSGALLVVQIHQ